MSASAEVYISADLAAGDTRIEVEEMIEKSLRELGFEYSDDRYNVGHYESGLIVEAKSYSCRWEVFEKDWVDKMVREILRIDETSDVEVYVYNLEREADLVFRTSMVKEGSV